jgi:hypothetical protein
MIVSITLDLNIDTVEGIVPTGQQIKEDLEYFIDGYFEDNPIYHNEDGTVYCIKIEKETKV